jgi:hypothetical protein
MHNTIYERKKELLTFLFAKPQDQPRLFRNIINKELDKMKEHIDSRPDDEELKKYNKQLDEMIYQSKLKGIEEQTRVLKEQMIAKANGNKHPSIISIIERKLFIVEMQLDIGVYNLIQNKNVKFYFEQ